MRSEKKQKCDSCGMECGRRNVLMQNSEQHTMPKVHLQRARCGCLERRFYKNSKNSIIHTTPMNPWIDCWSKDWAWFRLAHPHTLPKLPFMIRYIIQIFTGDCYTNLPCPPHPELLHCPQYYPLELQKQLINKCEVKK